MIAIKQTLLRATGHGQVGAILLDEHRTTKGRQARWGAIRSLAHLELRSNPHSRCGVRQFEATRINEPARMSGLVAKAHRYGPYTRRRAPGG